MYEASNSAACKLIFHIINTSSQLLNAANTKNSFMIDLLKYNGTVSN